MIDTHTHINTVPLLSDIDNIVSRANKNNVLHMIAVGMNKKANQQGILLSEKYPCIYAAIGLHPSDVNDEQLDIEQLEQQAKHNKVVAIGEIGIDLYWVKDNFVLQKEVFIKQIELALSVDLPVIIHSRNSANEIYDIVENYPSLRGVMHCYSENVELLDKFIDLGFYIGVGGIVTFKNAKEVIEIAKKTPLDRLLVETDAPYLAPVPYRGKTNEPAYTAYTLSKLAEIRGLTIAEMDRITTDNTVRLFTKMNIQKQTSL
ncbi:MAG: TatD family hydrolase [Acholeplasmataceae bacterium]|nr:TatD family hydrolase [Acholeplasmataceae bacterium]